VAMVWLEGMGGGDALWLTLTTVTTVGYGDLSAHTTAGRAATVLLLYLGGIFVLAKSAGDYFEYRTEKRLRKLRGEWDWDMQNHILIINTPTHNGERYFATLIQQLRSSERFRAHPVELVTTQFPEGLPESLSALGEVVHFHGLASDPETLRVVDAAQAAVVIVLAHDEHDPAADSWTFDILHRLRDAQVEGTVLAECVDDRNRARLLAAGADLVLRPMRSYPEMIVRGLVAPGAEQIIENMFTSANDEYARFDLTVSGLTWAELVTRVVQADCGLPVAYVALDQELVTNPPANHPVDACALLLMVRDEHRTQLDELRAALATR